MLKFGSFDHVDYNGKPLGEQLEERLKLIGLLEAEPYDVYHVAEHHSTPLGTIPSPSVFLAAVAERTKRIRVFRPHGSLRQRGAELRRAVFQVQ
jgi:alkanesulfonate monooxygenase SsuD/methylene tetrahydromethanopterin reductase-like flavin-dependent oxidoreductase (luciferase family)